MAERESDEEEVSGSEEEESEGEEEEADEEADAVQGGSGERASSEEGVSEEDESESDGEGATNAAEILEEGQRDGGRTATGLTATTSGAARGAAAGVAAGELPFTLEAPGSYEEFAALVAGRPAEELGLAVQRIRVCSAAALATGNRKKMQVTSHDALSPGQPHILSSLLVG